MKNFKRSKLFPRTFLFFFIAAMIPLLLMGILSYRVLESSLTSHIQNKLIAISDGRHALLERILADLAAFITERASGPTPIKAFNELTPIFETRGLHSDEYKSVENRYWPIFQHYLDTNESLYDILLISRKGDIIFSLKHENDLGKNIHGTELKDTSLSDLMDSVGFYLSVLISDYNIYFPSRQPALFIASPVFDNNEFIGTLVFQISQEILNRFAGDYAGLPSTGDIVLVKRVDNAVFSTTPTRFDPNATLKHKVLIGSSLSTPSQKAVNGETGIGFGVDYRKKTVLARWQYIPELRWGMVIKVDKDEVFQPIYRLRSLLLTTFFILVVFLAIASFIFSRNISKPIEAIRRSLNIIATGNLDHKIGIHRSDEIGELADNVDKMSEELKFKTASLADLNNEVSVRKAAEASFRESEERFRALFKLASVPFCFLDRNGTLRYFNDRFIRVFGYTPADIPSLKEWWPIAYPDEKYRQWVMKHWGDGVAKAKREGTDIPPAEYNITCKDGTVRIVEISGVPIGSSFLITFIDLTEHKKAQETIRNANREWENTFNSITDMIFILDTDHTIVKANKAFFEAMKLSPKDILGKKCHDIVHHLSHNWPGCPAAETMTKKQVTTVEVIDPELGIPLLVTTSPLIDDHGDIYGIVHIARDISEQKKAQKQIEETAEMKSRFISMVSHELRTPLGPIKEGAGIILDGLVGSVSQEQKTFLEVIVRNANRLNRLINDVLDFQKLGSGAMQFNIREHDIYGLINEVYATMKVMMREKGLEFNLEIEPDLPLIKLDHDRIIQVLTNLVNNAFKFTDKGSITIKAKKERDVLCNSVDDTGPGIRKEDIPKLFHTFSQLQSSFKDKTGGSGLGLAISKEIISHHGGRIWVESEPGKGSSFRFTLPI